MLRINRFLLIFVISLISLSLSAHYSWIRVNSGAMQTGVPAVLKISHGHEFPTSGQSLPMAYTNIYVRGADGKTTRIKPYKQSGFLTAEYKKIDEKGLYTFYFISNPGVMSKTTKGWKIGGMEKYPVAIYRIKKYESATAWVKTPNASWGKLNAVGLKYELLPVKMGSEIELMLIKNNQPFRGVRVNVILPDAKPKGIGKTDSNGMIRHKLPAGYNREILFSAQVITPQPEGAKYNREVIRTTTLIDFR